MEVLAAFAPLTLVLYGVGVIEDQKMAVDGFKMDCKGSLTAAVAANKKLRTGSAGSIGEK